MYKAFYGLSLNPFTVLPDPEFILPTRQHRMAMIMLESALMNGAPFFVLTGEIGTGKSTLVQNLLSSEERGITFGVINNGQASIGELLQWVLLAFKLPFTGKGKVEMYEILVDFVRQEFAQYRRVVLVIDEAHNLDLATLEELRMLSNINVGKQQMLQMILVGQSQLKDKLRQPELEQFAQRVVFDFHLTALSLDDSKTYIMHSLRVAGAEKLTIFTDAACESIHLYSGGIPRLINMICDMAMVYGFAEEQKVIGSKLVQAVAQDRQANGVIPLNYQHLDDDKQTVVTKLKS